MKKVFLNIAAVALVAVAFTSCQKETPANDDVNDVTTEETIDAATDSLDAAVDTIQEGAEDAVDQVQDAADNAVEEVKDATEEAAN